MTADKTESEAKTRRPRFSAHRRLCFGGIAVAASLLAAMAARYYGFGFSRDQFKEGLAALDRGDWSLARRYARELKASEPSSPQASFLRGAVLLEKGYAYPALDELRKAIQAPDLETAALTLMGEAWYYLGRHVEAQAVLEQAVKQDPQSVDAHRWLAASYYDLGAIGKALPHLERTAELDPTDPRPHRLLGLIHKDFGRFEEAIALYEESLRRRSDQPNADEIRQELASCQVEHAHYAGALKTLAKCPELPEFDVLRAKCHYAQTRLAAAKVALGRALEQQPDNLDGLLLHATMLLEEGEAREATEALERAVESHPKDYTAHFKLAQAYGEVGEQELSFAESETASKIAEVKVEFSELHKAAWERPSDMQVRLRLATLAQELDRPDLAEVWLRSAAALQPAPESEAK
ncbi:MAG TPA: tetratricopeptide repeat protein [Pirellulales bacterium]|nr:tetratricopeptide repeat protein [Pirellulales bacterium]